MYHVLSQIGRKCTQLNYFYCMQTKLAHWRQQIHWDTWNQCCARIHFCSIPFVAKLQTRCGLYPDDCVNASGSQTWFQQYCLIGNGRSEFNFACTCRGGKYHKRVWPAAARCLTWEVWPNSCTKLWQMLTSTSSTRSSKISIIGMYMYMQGIFNIYN